MTDEQRIGGRLDDNVHRRFLRYKLALGPLGSAMATHHPIQRFDA